MTWFGDAPVRAVEVLRELVDGHLDRELDGVFLGVLHGGLHVTSSVADIRAFAPWTVGYGCAPCTTTDELAFADELADRAGEFALSYFRNDPELHWKPDATPVTEADLAVEAMIREELAAGASPTTRSGARRAGSRAAADRMWIIDPIDGTRNYAAGIQIWANLLALKVQDDYVLGLANAPALGERYAAVRGEGATWNGEPMHVSDVGDDGRGHGRLRRRRALGRNGPARAIPGSRQRRAAEPGIRRLLGTHAGRDGAPQRSWSNPSCGSGTSHRSS